METIQVTARFESPGKITPLRFNWRGNEYPVVSCGRHWEDEVGHHFLVMVPNEKIYELLFSIDEINWYIKIQPAKSQAA